MDEYHRLSDNVLEHLSDQLIAIEDHIPTLPGFDCELAYGVLTLKLGSHGTYVLNKQPPNKQIWLSSPTSGPKRYDYDETTGKWVYHRDGSSLHNLLDSELRSLLKLPSSFSIHAPSDE